MRPTRRLVGLLAAGIVLAALPALVDTRLWTTWLVYLTGCALAAALDAARLPSRDAVEAAYDGPDEIPVGEEVPAWIQVKLLVPRRFSFEIAVDLSPELAARPVASGRLEDEGVRVALPLLARRRGVVVVERAWLRLTGPLGLMTRVVVLPLGVKIAVRPVVRLARGAALSLDESLSAPAGLKSQRFEGDGSEFDALSEFRPGDDHRRIDWKSSARHRSLLRRQFRAERDHQVVLALDTGRLMAVRLDGIPKLDHAVGAALRLAYVALRSGDRVGLFGFDEQPHPLVPPRGGLQSQPALARAAARLSARESETNFTLGLTALQQTLRRRTLVLVMTDFSDTVSAELLVESLRRLVRRHAVIFVTLGDPSLEAIATRRPDDRDTLHRAVVARTLARERAVVIERLRRLGIHPIQASPADLSTEMINRYLALRRREVA